MKWNNQYRTEWDPETELWGLVFPSGVRWHWEFQTEDHETTFACCVHAHNGGYVTAAAARRGAERFAAKRRHLWVKPS